MWEAYQRDPASVDPAWRELFESGTNGVAHASPAAPATTPKEPSAPREAHVEPPRTDELSLPTTGSLTTQAKTTSARPKPQPIPAEAPSKQADTQAAAVAEDPAPPTDEIQALRGVSKTIAANMDQSLEVPPRPVFARFPRS